MYTPCQSYVCFVLHFEISPQVTVLCALLSAVFRNNGVANLRTGVLFSLCGNTSSKYKHLGREKIALYNFLTVKDLNGF